MSRALILSLFAPALLLAQQAAVPDVAMKDQFDKPHDVKDHRGDVVVLIYGDKGSAEANSALGGALHVHYHPSAKGQSPADARKAPVKPVPGAPNGARSPDVLAVPVACHKTASKAAQATIRLIVRANATVPVWLDFDGTMSDGFAFEAGVPNIAVLDARGRYRYAASGQMTGEGMAKLVAVVDGLRKEAVEGR